MKWPIRILLALIAIPVLLIAILAIVLFTIDPNQFKPHIEHAAQKQSIDVKLNGDIEWQLWPNFGLHVQDVSFEKNDSTQKMSASAQSLGFSVALPPLFKKEVQINGVTLSDAQLNIRLLASSEQEPQAPAAQPDPATPNDQGAPTIAVDNISLNNITVTIIDDITGDTSKFTLEQLNGSSVSVDGTPFPLDLKANAQLPELPLIAIQLNSQLAFNLEGQNAEVIDGELTTQISSSEVRAELTSSANWSQAFKSNGALNIQSFSPKQVMQALNIELPEMQNKSALTDLALRFNYTLDHDQLAVKNIAIKLDSTQIKGDIQVDSLERLKLSSHWTGDQINIDDYLPPPSEAEEETTEPESMGEAIELPLELLRQLDVDFSLKFDQVQMKGLKLDKPSFELKAQDGVIEVKELNSKVADGEIKATSQLNVKGPQAQLKFAMDSSGVQLGQILAQMANVNALNGSAQLNLDGSSQGNTDQALIKNLQANMQLTSDQLQLVPINLEKQFCNALALLQKQTPPQYDWPEQTTLKPASMNILLNNEVLNLKNLDATIAKLLGSAKGSFNLASGDFNVPFSLSLGSFGGEIEGCLPIPEKWRKRALPIRCKGNVDDIGVKTCLPDTRLIEDMIKEKIKQKADEKIEEKKDQVEQKLKDKIKEELGEEKTEAAKEQLKGLFDQIKKK